MGKVGHVSLFFLFLFLFFYLWSWACSGLGVEVRGQPWSLVLTFYLAGYKASCCLLLAFPILGFSCLCLPVCWKSMGYRPCETCTWSWEPNWGPHANAVCTLPTESPPQPCYYHTKRGPLVLGKPLLRASLWVPLTKQTSHSSWKMLSSGCKVNNYEFSLWIWESFLVSATAQSVTCPHRTPQASPIPDAQRY